MFTKAFPPVGPACGGYDAIDPSYQPDRYFSSADACRGRRIGRAAGTVCAQPASRADFASAFQCHSPGLIARRRSIRYARQGLQSPCSMNRAVLPVARPNCWSATTSLIRRWRSHGTRELIEQDQVAFIMARAIGVGAARDQQCREAEEDAVQLDQSVGRNRRDARLGSHNISPGIDAPCDGGFCRTLCFCEFRASGSHF